MAEELGRIQRPTASQYDGRRKLLLVPLIYGPQADDPAGAEVLQNYWEQMQTQVDALEAALGGLQHIYHESLTVGGDEGLEQLGAADQRSHGFITAKTRSGAVLEATEDMDVLLETLDLQRCMMIPLASANVGSCLQNGAGQGLGGDKAVAALVGGAQLFQAFVSAYGQAFMIDVL